MSFGLSRGKTQILEGYGIDHTDLPPLEAGRIDPRHWFDQPEKSFELEIGSGKGTFLLQQAKLHPDVNYLGIEWAGEFYRFAADRMRRHQLTNVRVLHTDGTEFIHHRCIDACVSVVHLYFSDPWPKKRHHKRRVVQDRTLMQFHRVLEPAGELRLVTDHDELWTWYEDHATRNAAIFERREFEAPGSAQAGEMVGSNFERKYQREGRPFHAMTLKKRLAGTSAFSGKHV